MARSFFSALRIRPLSLLLAASMLLLAGAVGAQSWPSKSITLVVPFPREGPTDVAARIVAAKMSGGLKQSIIIDNSKTGASGTLGAKSVAGSAPDGYTLLMLTSPTLLAKHLYPPLNYDLFTDFTPVGTVGELPLVMVVNPKLLPNVYGLQDFIAAAKAAKKPMNYSSPGTAGFGHLATERLKKMAQFDMQHVPYRGSAPAVIDLVNGQLSMMFTDLISVQTLVDSGALRPIAIGSLKPLASLPGVRTVSEQGFEGFEATPWAGIVAPAKTPKEIVARLSEELKRALADGEVRKKLEAAGAAAFYEPPEQMTARMKRDFDRWGMVIQENGISIK